MGKAKHKRSEQNIPAFGAAQRRYAVVLSRMKSMALILMLSASLLGLTGLSPPAVPFSELPNYWHLSSGEYVQAINQDYLRQAILPTGWAWLPLARHGDYLALLSIALLGLVTIVCYASVLPVIIGQRRKTYSVIVVLQIILLALAASGLLH